MQEGARHTKSKIQWCTTTKIVILLSSSISKLSRDTYYVFVLIFLLLHKARKDNFNACQPNIIQTVEIAPQKRQHFQ